MTCPYCGRETRNGSKFCEECGRPLAQNSRKIDPLTNSSQAVFAIGAAAREARLNADYSGVEQLSRRGYTVLLSTHNPQHALTFADRILALSGGTVAAFGAPAEVLTPKLMKTLYRVDVDFAETAGGAVIVPLTGGEV